MPKVVDHDSRRAAIIEATCAVIATEGLEAATMRRIAIQAGSTTGLVTHYFSQKTEILMAALRHVHDTAAKRMIGALQADGEEGPDERLRAVVAEALPLDARRLDEWRVWLAFWGQASSNGELQIEQRSRYEEWTTLLVRLLAEADVAIPVEGLIALIDGIGTRVALDPAVLEPHRQLEIVERFLYPEGGR